MSVENSIKAFVAIVGLASFVFGVVKFIQVQAVEAETPYLTRKLTWCEEAVETTAKIATAIEPNQADIDRFWQMYWGVMGLIEKQPITDAMVAFGKELDETAPSIAGAKDEGTELAGLRGRSLELAYACRRELSAEWSPSWAVTQ